jgi:hypothetical protein
MGVRKMTEEVFTKICNDLQVSHEGLNTLCKKRNSSAPAFYDFMELDDKYTELYTRARERQADYLADLIHEVAFDGSRDDTPFTGGNHVQRDKLKVESLKWTAAKLKPKKYGEKIDVTSDGNELEAQTVIVNLGTGVDPNETTD